MSSEGAPVGIAQLQEKVKQSKAKFIIVTGGVCSSLGKGVLVSAKGVLLKKAGYTVSVIKWDPYLNVDPGTMSPLVHGEVFVTADGAETDLDLGHYERLIGVRLTRDSSVSSGQIFQEILDGEREGRFLGKCIQLVPHVIDVIKQRFLTFALTHDVDFVLLEIGGTVGDIEGEIFLEAIRQLKMDLGQKRIMHSHLSYVPFLTWSGEVKTKPTQHSVIQLKKYGLIPDSLFLRADKEIEQKATEKIAVMCGVDEKFIFQALTVDPVYNVFLDLDRQEVGSRIQEFFGLAHVKKSDLSSWKDLIRRIEKAENKVKIGLIAKYVGSSDPYISVVEAIKSAGYYTGWRLEIEVIEAEALEKNDSQVWDKLKSLNGIIVPGGFDVRGCEGKIKAAKWARENKIPYLGLCLGLHILMIDYARSVLGLQGASSAEFDPKTPHPVISLLDEQKGVTEKGASMRLGSYPCRLVEGTRAHDAYQQDMISERHRHRYEVNNDYKKDYEEKGIIFSGIYPKKDLVEIAEIKDHPFMVGCQFHPEFQSSPLRPHPLYRALVEAAIKNKTSK